MQKSFRVTEKVGRKNPTHLFNLPVTCFLNLLFKLV
nr:MAG TPA: hypothetical protein [Caudoviricetes sp.]